MFTASALTTLLALAAAPLAVRADVTPSEPGPGDSFNVGATCHIAWDGDSVSTTVWKNMAIELMTGDNFNMVHLTTVAINQDGTKSGTFDYPCPAVSPNSAIYFYQFSTPLAPANNTWTTRFTIASASGATTPPANAVQPVNPATPGTPGAAIPWGVGKLDDASTAVAAPNAGTTTGAGTAGTGTDAPATAGTTTGTPAAAPSSTPTFATVKTSPTAATNAVVSPSTTGAANSTQTDTSKSAALAVSAGSARVWAGAAALLALAAAW